jgi:ribonuclease P protein component
LRHAGTRRRSGPVVITALLDPSALGPRVAFAVNRSVGVAVRRNLLRRRLRAIVRGTDLAPGAYLVAASTAAAAMPYHELAAHVRNAVPQ